MKSAFKYFPLLGKKLEKEIEISLKIIFEFILHKAERQSMSANRSISKISDARNESEQRKSFQNPRAGGAAMSKFQFKSKKQQTEEEAKRNLLKARIKCNYERSGGMPPIFFF